MQHPLKLCVFSAVLSVAAMPLRAQQKRPITFHDLISVERVSEPAISPDGRWVAYTLAQPDLAANRINRNLWIASATGDSEPRQLTRGGSDSRPQWAPDGKQLAFVSSRTGTEEIYLLALSGGEATPLTTLSTGAGNEQWSPDGSSIAFTSAV